MKNSLLSERSSSFALEQEIQTLLEQSSHPHQREDQHQGSLSSLLLKMRKYYKLVLVVVTVVSLVCFLFYKTQYDKLYNVLQVLEFFGDPGSSNGSPVLCPIPNQGNLGSSFFSRPPAFQRVTPDVFVYSSFCQRSPPSTDHPESAIGDCEVVMTLAVGRIATEALAEKLKCKLWYEGSLQPVQGIVSVEKARLGTDNSDGASSDGKNTFVPYHIGCESKYSSKSPYGILFVHEKEESFVHVFGSSAPAPPPSKTLGLCLLPPETLEDTTSAMLENVLLHSYFGVKNFVLYDRGLTHKFLDTVSEARQKDDALLSVSLLPWNPPVKLEPEVTEYLVSADCTQRTKAEFQSVAVLKPSQILVPRAARTVGEVLKGQPWAWGPLQVDVLRFCSEFPENPRAAGNEYSINALEQTTFDEEGSEVGGLRLMHRDAANKDRNGPGVVPRDTLAVHDYAPCNKFEFGDTSAKEELHVFNRVSSIQDKIGKYFHHKSV